MMKIPILSLQLLINEHKKRQDKIFLSFFCQCFFLPLYTDTSPAIIQTIPTITDIPHTKPIGEPPCNTPLEASLKISSTVLNIMYAPMNNDIPPNK